MSEEETSERVVRVPLQFIKPLPFNTTVIDEKAESMLREEMKRPEGPEKVDPIILRKLTPEEIEKYREKNPWVKYEIVDGHTRFRIAEQLKWPWIRARIIDVSQEEAYEINYRKNKERGTVSQLAEAIYFKHLQADLKMSPWEIAEKFGLEESEVSEILSRAVLPRDARGYIMSKLPEVGKRVSSKHLKLIASTPPDKQRVLAEAIIEGGLRPDEAERAKEAIIQGLPKEEAIRVAKELRKRAVVKTPAEAVPVEAPTEAPIITAPPPAVSAAPEPTESIGEIICPKCGAKAKVDWASRRVEWVEA